MRVKVLYWGEIADVLNKKEEIVEISDESTFSDLLNKLTEMYGERFEQRIFQPDSEEIRNGFIATLNGTLMGQLRGLDTELKDGDSVTLITFMSGGG